MTGRQILRIVPRVMLFVCFQAACGEVQPGTNGHLPDAAPPLPDAEQEPDALAEQVVAKIEPVEVGRTEPCDDATHLTMGPEGNYETMRKHSYFMVILFVSWSAGSACDDGGSGATLTQQSAVSECGGYTDPTHEHLTRPGREKT